MKIDRSKAKRSSTEVPPDCKGLIDKLKACLDCKELCFVLEKVQTWTYGKCELYHWMDVLDTFDSILEEACEKTSEQTWLLRCDTAEFQLKNREKFKCLTLVLRFTTMLIEHSFSRHLYNSMDHLTSLLGSELPELVLDVLNLIYMFSKRSNFLSRLLDGRKEALLERLTYLAESWGGRDAGFGLGACCLDKKNSDYPENATTVHMEFTTASKPDSQPGVATRSKQNELLTIVHIENVDRLEYDTPILMDRICEKYKIPQEKQMLLFTRLRLARHFTTYYRRVILVQLRLQSLSVLVYANAIHDNMHQLVYTGLLEELVELIGFEDHRLDNTKATALRCLTSIIHLDRGQSFPSTVIEITGANSFHGFLPKMVRKCITALLLPPPEDDSGSPKSAYPFHLATALFSFVYHLSSFEPGGEALVSCGMMESLLRVISWKSTEIEHITFVTRAVRVIDLVTNMDMQSFHVQDGLGTFLSRLEVEIAQCRLEEPFEIVPDLSYRQTEASNQNSESAEDITETAEPNQDGGEIVMESDSNSMQDETTRAVPPRDEGSAAKFVASGVTCLPQRAALLKSMFNFLKKVIQDPAFSEGIRHLVETTFPNLLKHIISNAEYYGPSLFMLATDIVTVTVFQEPSVLSTFQDLGLTDVVQEALLVKDIPATREVIASLPNVFSALCLNSRGLNAFVLHKPFPKIFKILISPEYLPAMRRRRTAETFGDTASNLGNAMDELMRHQPSLKVDATSAMVTLLRTLNKMGCDPKYSCWKPQVKPAAPLNNTNNRNGTSEGGSSEEDDDDEEEPSAASHNGPPRAAEDAVDDPIQPTSSYMSSIVSSNEEKAPVPFVDYICNVMKFVDAILSNNSTDDHCREFVNQDGIYPLMEILSAPNLPNDFPNSQACMAVASVCKSILNLAHEGRVLLEGLTYLEVVLEKLEVLNLPAQGVGSSVLLRELAKADIPVESIGNPRDTPILNSITAAHAHIMMFVHVCRTGQSDIRAMSVTNWGSPQGVRVLRLLSKLYLNLVWESTVLLALCTGEYQPGPKEFAREDLDRLIPKEEKTEPTEVSIKGSRVVLPTVQPTNAAASPSDIMDIDNDSNASSSTGGNQDNSVTTLVSSATQTGGGNQKTDKAILSSTTLQSYSKLLKPILSASSRLGRALAELFGLLVKLCVGSPIRQRRGHQLPTVTGFATPGSSAVAKLLAELLTDGLRWEPKPNSPVSRLTFSICTVGFSAPLLFDDKKFAYHLMLRKFTNSGGLKSLFEVFYWALAAEDNPQEIASRTDPIFTDQQVEFLDCWLTLVEKICNPKTVLESPHTYPVKTAIRQLSLFDSGHFLTYAHKLAFHALMHLWNQRSLKAIGPRAADTMLIILGHIIRHRDIEEREAKFQEDKNANPAPSTSAPSTSSSATSAVTSVAPADAPRDLSSTTEQPIAVVRMALELIDRADLSPCNETENAMNSTISQENVESVSLPPAEPSPVDLQQDPLAITNISNAEGEQGTTTEAISEGASHTVALNINPVPLPATDDQHNGNSNEVVPITPDASAPSTSQPDPGTSSVAGAASAALEMGVDYTQVQQLMDMGFPLEMCIEALIATDSVVHATDYLLNNGERVTTSFARTGSAAATPAAAQVPNTRRGPGQGPMDWDYNDEEQMLRAIAMSLGEPTLKISNIVGAKAAAEKQTWKPPETLKAEDIDSFTENILIRSLAIVDQLPECVFRISELLVAIGQRSGADWMGKILNTLVEQIVNSLAMVEKIANEDDKPLNALCVRAESDLLAIRVHLFSLMFEELKTMCAYLLEKWEVIDPAIHLLELLHEAHQNFPGQSKHTPKWLAPLILMIDLYEKSVVATRRRHRLAEETDHIWKWFDINSGKWCAYSTINNNNIDKAFWEGESSLRIMAGRRRYVINFSGMIQLNEETNNRRPIALWLKTVKKEGAKAVEASCKTSSTPANMEVNGEISDLVGGGDASKFATTANIECNFEQLKSDKMDVQDSFTSEEHDDKCISLLRGLNDRQVLSIIRSSVGYMEYPVIPDALHASMRLCLRVTRDHEVAVIFSQFGGVQALVNLKVSSGFHGFLPLANLLIRHVLEDPACLRYAIEKMIRAKAISTSASTCKELHYLLRVLAPVACRSPSLFVEVAKDILRVDINFVTRRGIHAEEDLRLIVKPIPCKPDTFKTYMGKAAQSVIHQLLRALLEPEDEEESSTPNSATGNPLSEAVTETSSDYAHPDLSEATPPTPVEVALPTIDVAEDGLPETLATRPPSSPLKIPKNKENDPPKRLIPKFAIFQLLAESVHSYSYSCKIIAEYCFQGKTHKDIPEDCTALAFLLDRMLPTDQYIGQVNCHGLVKDLLGVMAGCNHLPEAQVIIISEVKAALQRAVNMKESVEKHCRIQCLAYLIAHMVESCSPTIPTQMVTTVKTTQFSMNPVVKLLLKKNVVVDLTRIPLHLDLTSKYLSATTNAVLKALELITRIVNQPAPNNVSRPKPPKAEANQQDSVNITHTGGTSNSEGTHAQGEETVEDADNTEHDISAAAESLDPTSESHAQEQDPTDEGDEGALEEIMDQLLDRESSQRVDDQILSDTLIAESQANRMDIDTGDNPRHNADYEEDHDHDHNDTTTDSGSDHSDDAGEEGEDEDDDDEDEDDDDEDDDDDDGGSNFDDNEQGFMEEGFIRFPALDRDEEMLMVRYGAEPENAPIFFTNNTSYNFNTGLFDDPLINEPSTGLRVTHPLLSAPTAEAPSSSTAANRGHRTGRQRRYQYFQYINPRHPHPPAILQRLLGPSTAQEVITLTAGQGLNPGIRDARLLVMDTTVDAPSGGPINHNMFTGTPNSGNCPFNGYLANYTALHWWCEEAKALDGESMHDCVTSIKREIIETVESDRDQIFKGRREKRAKEVSESRKKDDNVAEVAHRTTHSHGSNLQASVGVGTYDGVPDLVSLSRRLPHHRPIQIVREERRIAEGDQDDSDSSDGSMPALLGLGDTIRINDTRAVLPVAVDSQEALLAPVEISNQESEAVNTNADPVRELPNVTGTDDLTESSDSNQGSIFGAGILDGLVLGNAAPGEEDNRDLMGVLEGLEALTPSPVNAVNALSADRNTNQTEDTPVEPVAGPSGSQVNDDFRNILGDMEVPEGVDPSFLAALPEEMRQEVIAEHLRQQRQRQRTQNPVAEATPVNVMDVSPEFLAALPPNIQEEVLAQQRIEQQRRVAVAGNPNDPVDAEAFFRNLQPSLRQAILADIEESQIAVLPPELVTEAQNLRRELETRNRQLFQDRFFTHSNANPSTTLSSILRNSMRLNSRYTLQGLATRHGTSWGGGAVWPRPNTALAPHSSAASTKVKGKQLVDHETLSCLLIMLFLDDPKINTGKLHRVLRNLCYHTATRQWVIKSLLSIIERSSECKLLPEPEICMVSPSVPANSLVNKDICVEGLELIKTQPPTWLNIRLDAVLGSQANVFQIQKIQTTGKKGGSDQRHISIHPQAINQICRHVLDVLSNLAKSFPCHFLPNKNKIAPDGLTLVSQKTASSDKLSTPTATPDKSRNASTSSGSGKSKFQQDGPSVEFFDLLLKLDSSTSGRKGKSLAKSHSNPGGTFDLQNPVCTFDESPFGQLISMLNHSFIRRSTVLTDKLLRLLSLISLGIPDSTGYGRKVMLEEPEVQLEESFFISESHLRLIIDVITSKSCSDEGLEEATALLLNLSFGPPSSREKIVKNLMQGLRELGNVICSHIQGLISELQKVNSTIKTESKESTDEAGPSSGNQDQEHTKRTLQGTLMDRFTKETVVVSAGKGKLISCELQLPSMGPLTSKTSSQAFFLRLLKVVISLRDAIRAAIRRHHQKVEAEIAAETAALKAKANSTPSAPTAGPNSTGLAEAAQSMDVDGNESVGAAGSSAPESSNTKVAAETSTGQTSDDQSTEEMKPNIIYVTDIHLLPRLSTALSLKDLWDTLSQCLLELGHTPDHHAVLVLQPAVEAFFLVHSSLVAKDDKKNNMRESREAQLAHIQEDFPPAPPEVEQDTRPWSELTEEEKKKRCTREPIMDWDTLNFLIFAQKHRTVLNQILRQSSTHLADGPFSVLVDHTRVLDFDVKRRYCRTELERLDEGVRREDLAVHVRRSHVFEDSFRELQRRSSEEWKNRFYIVFEGEEGQDAGGLLREWYMIISREIFNPMYALFTVSPGDRVTYMINPSSHCNSNHLFYFKFVGRVIAKAIYDNKLLECYFTRSFYKHILGKYVKHSDMESEDYSFYQGLAFLMDNNVSELGYDLTLSTEVQEFGVTEIRDLVPSGRNIPVTEENKMEYIRLVCQMKMTGAIRKQLNAFLEGFYDIIPKRLISIFNEQELELLVSGLPNVDIEDLKANTEYHKYQQTSLQIQWFWRALRSFDQAGRAKFLQFVTGTSKVPLQGFEALEGMNGVQKFQIHRDDRSTDRLPSAHTCFNQLDLPAYETYDKLRSYLLKAIHECSEGFGFA